MGRDQIKGIAVMTGSMVLFAVMGALVRYAGQEFKIDSYKMAMFRFAIGLALLGTVLLAGKIRLDFHRKGILVLRGVLGGTAVFLYFLSITKLGVAKGTVISQAFPVFATIMGAIFLKERVGLLKGISVALAFGGLVLIGSGSPGGFQAVTRYDILALAGAVLAGGALVTVRSLRRTDSSFAIFFSQCLFGFWIMLIPANFTPAEMDIGWIGGGLLLAIGITAAIGQLMFTWSYKHVNIATGSLIALLMPVFSILIGVFVFQEELTMRALAGMAIVLIACGSVMIQRREKQTEEGVPKPDEN